MSVDSTVLGEHFFNWPFEPSSVMNCGRPDSKAIGPLINCHRFALKLNEQARLFLSAIVCLFSSCRPSAVAGLIIPVVVDAVNRVVKAWTLAHVVTKSIKRVEPSIADRYAAFTVAVKAGCQRAKTAVSHRLPRFVGNAVAATVRDAPVFRNIDRKTPATPASVANRFISQIRTCSKAFISAGASTSPNNKVIYVASRKRNDSEPAECLPGEVENSVVEFRTLKTFAMINLSHDQFLFSEGRLWLEPMQCYSTVRLASLYNHECEVCNV